MITKLQAISGFYFKIKTTFSTCHQLSDHGTVGKVLKYNVVTETDELIGHDYVAQVHLAPLQYLLLDKGFKETSFLVGGPPCPELESSGVHKFSNLHYPSEIGISRKVLAVIIRIIIIK